MTRSRKAASQSDGVFSGSLVPLTARPTFFYDIRSAPLNGICMGVLTLLPWVLKHTFGGSDWEVALLWAAAPTAHIFDLLWAHLCADGRKMPWVLWPGLVSRLFMVLVGLAVNSTTLVLFGTLSYVIGSMSTPAISSILRTNYPGTHRYRVQGVVMAVMGAVMATVAFGASVLLHLFDWPHLFRVVFATGGVCGMLGVYVYSRIKVRDEPAAPTGAAEEHTPEPPRRRVLARVTSLLHGMWTNTSLLWKNPKFGKYQLLQFTSGFANIMTGPVLVALLKNQGVGWVGAGLVLGVAPHLARAVVMPFMGRLLQRYNPMQARAFFNLFWVLAYVLIALSGDAVGWVIAGRLFMGVAWGATMLLWVLQQMYFSRKEDVPRYMGIHCTLTGIRGLAAPFFGVWMMNVFDSTHVVFVFSAILALAAAYLCFRMARHEKRTTNFTGHVDGGGLEDYTDSES